MAPFSYLSSKFVEKNRSDSITCVYSGDYRNEPEYHPEKEKALQQVQVAVQSVLPQDQVDVMVLEVSVWIEMCMEL